MVMAIALLFQAALGGQRAFDVASIKENKDIAAGGSLRIMPDGGIRAVHIPARTFVTVAYSLQPFQLVGAPAWLSEVYYDLNAKPEGKVTRQQTFAMLQALVVDRFKLAFHRETRELDGFALVQARPGTFGPNLKPSSIDCGDKAQAATPYCREGSFTHASVNTMKSNGAPIWNLMTLLVGEVRAPVIDETKLTGTFDMDLRWSPDMAPSSDLPSIYTALQEQLGLKLERRRVPAEVFVIDRIERPSPD
jgi:uncharacterized protein (TIGR03435 family)